MQYCQVKKLLFIVLALTLGVTASAVALQRPVEGSMYQQGKSAEQDLEQQARQKTAEFGRSLKQALVSAIQSEGFPYAVDVCKIKAPDIAQKLSSDGWQVARTSLKTRNPANRPDPWESEMLSAFDAAFKAGKPADKLTAIFSDTSTFRFMQAIPTGKVCLACHGQQVEPGLLQRIQTNYPDDSATGFTLEDIRGAFTLSKELEQ